MSGDEPLAMDHAPESVEDRLYALEALVACLLAGQRSLAADLGVLPTREGVGETAPISGAHSAVRRILRLADQMAARDS